MAKYIDEDLDLSKIVHTKTQLRDYQSKFLNEEKRKFANGSIHNPIGIGKDQLEILAKACNLSKTNFGQRIGNPVFLKKPIVTSRYTYEYSICVMLEEKGLVCRDGYLESIFSITEFGQRYLAKYASRSRILKNCFNCHLCDNPIDEACPCLKSKGWLTSNPKKMWKSKTCCKRIYGGRLSD